jgi:hypothetical protein
MDAMGLLLANKQIHEEANTTLFSKNVFLIMVEWERVYPFWRCENPGCYPPGSPCFIMFDYFKKIKHVYIIITNTRAMTDPLVKADSLRINQNLKAVARCFREGGNKLKTLKIRYTSCFDGQIDAVRDSLEGELADGMPERRTMLKDRHGKYHHVSRAEAAVKLFKYHKILDPLRALKGIAELMQIRGDLPGAYMEELKTILSVPTSKLGAIAKRKRETEEAERKKRQEQDKGSGFHAFMKTMVEKYKGTPDEKTYRDMLKVSAKSPAVMADLMKPPTKEELERYRREYPVDQATAGPAGSTASSDSYANGDFVEEEEDIDVGSEGVGMIDGKPVFGPPRPPGLL